MRKVLMGLVALGLLASPASAQMGGMGGGGGGMGGGMGGGGGPGGGGPGGDHGGDGPPGGEPRKPREMKPIPQKIFDKAVEGMFRVADLNKDGIVTLAEYEEVVAQRRRAVIHARFLAVDTNHDKIIDEAEFQAWQGRKGSAALVDEPVDFGEIISESIEPELGNGQRDLALSIAVEALNPVVITKADANYDGNLTLDELLAYERARFKKADTNDDGYLSTEEIAAMRGPRSGGKTGPMGGPPMMGMPPRD
jgi:hypothetical protein